MKLDLWWQGKCKSCKHYWVEIEDGVDEGNIFPGLGYCHCKPPRVLMDPDGKAVTPWPEVTALDGCGAWTQSDAIQMQRS